MKKFLFLTILTTVACASVPKFEHEWVLDHSNAAQMKQFFADQNECQGIAEREKYSGNRAAEWRIKDACLEHKGYKTRTVMID